jgi:hypothetical protein
MKGITPKQRAKSLTTLLNKTYDPCGARRNVTDMSPTYATCAT